MNLRQPSWDKYEAVILLEGLLASMKGKVTRSDTIKSISQDLRKMALSRGAEIDDVFRNENGISFQLHSMESAYHGHMIFKPATKLFTEVANLYHKSQDEYQKLLKEAKAMISCINSVENDFMQHLASKVSPAQLSELYLCYSEIEGFCLKLKVLQKPLFQTTDFEIIKKVQRTIEQNKIFRITHKKQYSKIIVAGRHYYTYIKEGHYPKTCTTSNVVVEDSKVTTNPIEKAIFVDTISEQSLNIPIARNEQDNRLLKKYPIIYKRVFNTLKESFHADSNSVSIRFISEKINRIARPAVIEEILDNASWALSTGENYVFSVEMVDHSVVINEIDEKDIETVSSDDTTYEIDFNRSFDLAYTRPDGFSYFGEKKVCANSWADLYVNLVATLSEDYPHIFKPGMSFSRNNSRIEIADNTDYDFMIAPKAVPGTEYMLETNISATNVATKIKYILNLCNIDYENIVITYRKKLDPSYSVNRENKSRTIIKTRETEINVAGFSRYMADTLNMAEATCRSYASAINNCENFAREHRLSSWRLYTENKRVAQETVRQLLSNADFLEHNARQHNRCRAALQKFLAFIGSELPCTETVEQTSEIASSYENKAYEEVLRQFFKKGFRMNSPLEIRKFRRYYSATHNAQLTESDDDISRNIKLISIVYDKKAFLPDIMLSEELREKLLMYIKDAFTNGTAAIYYQALYTEFAEEFLDYHIYNADMLKFYLMYVGNGRFYINRSFISRIPNVVLDPLSEIRSCLQGYGRPVEYDELFNALPHLPQNKIKSILTSNGEFVNNGRGVYFHESIVRLSDEQLNEIIGIIRQTVAEKNFIGGNELYDAVKSKLPFLMEDNHYLSVYGFRDALKAKLGSEFSFKGNIISRFGEEISMSDVFAKYARDHDSFTLAELQGLANNLATVIYFEPVYENSLRISRDEFVSKEAAQFSISDTDEAIDRVCTGKYITIKDITNFGCFPYAGFTWNNFLLEHYVSDYSQKYMLLHSGFNSNKCVGAIVKRSARINSFDDLIVDLLVSNTIEMKKKPVLQFLSENEYLAQRRYSGIESLIIKANALRQRKDKD